MTLYELAKEQFGTVFEIDETSFHYLESTFREQVWNEFKSKLKVTYQVFDHWDYKWEDVDKSEYDKSGRDSGEENRQMFYTFPVEEY